MTSTEPQVFPHEAEARQGEEAEPSHPPVDSPPNGQHHPVRFEPRENPPYPACLDGIGYDDGSSAHGFPGAHRRTVDIRELLADRTSFAATTPSGGTGARPVSASRCITPRRDCLLLLFFPINQTLFTIPTTSCHDSRWTDEINGQLGGYRCWSDRREGGESGIIMDYD